MELPTTIPIKAVISVVVDEVARDFISLADALTDDQHFASQISPATAQDEFSRFKLWAGNIAAHRRGNRSLEYRYAGCLLQVHRHVYRLIISRLRDAAHLKTQTHDLLDALAKALRNGK